MKHKNKFLPSLLCLALTFFAWVGFAGCTEEKPKDTVISTQEETLEFSISSKELFIYSSFQLHVNQADGVVFESSNESVATVDENGLVYASGFGEATITATFGELQAQCTLTVTGQNILPSIAVSQEDILLVWSNKEQSGSSFEVNPQIKFNGDTFADGTFRFYSSDSSVVSVDANGKISATGIGKAVVSIQGIWRNRFDESVLNKTVNVTVMPNASIELIPESSQISTVSGIIDGKEYSNQTLFSATVLVDGEVYNAPITYLINGEDATKIKVTVDGEDNVIFWDGNTDENSIVVINGNTITGNNAGEASIVAQCVVDGIKISSVPMVITVVAPMVEANGVDSIHNVKENPVYKLPEIEGKLISFSLNGVSYNDYVDVDSLSLDFSEFYEDVLGENLIEIATTKYNYHYSVKFVTHVISNEQEFSDCIANKDSTIYAIMTKDISFSVGTFQATSTAFSGVFDGQGHTIDASGTKISSVYGLFGRLKGELKNFALINVTVFGKESTVLGERIYEGGSVNNLYVQAVYEENTQKDYTSLDAKGTLYYCGLFNRGFRFENVIVNIQYPANIKDGYALCAYSNVIVVKNSYCFGNAAQLAKTNSSACYKNLSAMLIANVGALTYKNGFSQYWYFNDKIIRLGDLQVGELIEKTRIESSQSITLPLSQLTQEDIVKIFIDGKSIEIPSNNELVIEAYKYSANEEHILKILTDSCEIKQPFIFELNEEQRGSLLYGKESVQVNCADYEGATSATVNGEVFIANNGVITIDLTALTIGKEYDTYFYTADKVIKQSVVRVTHIIATLEDLKAYLPNSGEVRAKATIGTYAVLTADIDFNGELYSAGTGNTDGYRGHFNGLGHTISNVLLKHEGGFFGVLYKGAVVENVRFDGLVYEGKNLGGALIAATVGKFGVGEAARIENVYIQGTIQTEGACHGLVNIRTYDKNTLVMTNCIVDITFAQPAEVSYALGGSEGEMESSLTNVYVRSNATQYTKDDGTVPYATTAELLGAACESVETWGGYWSVVDGEIYFNGEKVVSK